MLIQNDLFPTLTKKSLKIIKLGFNSYTLGNKLKHQNLIVIGNLTFPDLVTPKIKKLTVGDSLGKAQRTSGTRDVI